MADEKVQVSVRVPAETRKQLRVAAAMHDCSLNDIVEVLANHLDDMPLAEWVAQAHKQ